MKLFLASEGGHADTIKQLESYLGTFIDKKIAYIPTAANGESMYGAWKTDSDTWKIVNTLGAIVKPVVLEEYKNSTVLKEFENQDVIWMAGGYCGYLMYWLRRCEVDTHIRELLGDHTLYFGSSAGSMVTASTLDIVEGIPYEREIGASVIPGLGLVDFDFFPHYQDEYYDGIKQSYHGKKLYLVKNGEQLIVEDNQIKVIGEERIIYG